MARIVLTDADIAKFTVSPQPPGGRNLHDRQVVLEPGGVMHRKRAVVLSLAHWSQVKQVAEAAGFPISDDLTLEDCRFLAAQLGPIAEALGKVVGLLREGRGVCVRRG